MTLTPAYVRNLALLTLRNPAQAARQVLALELGREVLWTGFALAVVANTFFFTLQQVLIPAPEGTPAIFTSHTAYFAMVAGGQAMFIYALYLAGTWMGGQGTLHDVLALMVWLQLLQAAAQALLLILMLTAPVLFMAFNMVAMIYGLYILVHFIDQAHGLSSLGRAVGVLAAALFSLAFALALLLALAGGSMIGMPNV
jgi:Yip1-like protein